MEQRYSVYFLPARRLGSVCGIHACDLEFLKQKKRENKNCSVTVNHNNIDSLLFGLLFKYFTKSKSYQIQRNFHGAEGMTRK